MYKQHVPLWIPFTFLPFIFLFLKPTLFWNKILFLMWQGLFYVTCITVITIIFCLAQLSTTKLLSANKTIENGESQIRVKHHSNGFLLVVLSFKMSRKLFLSSVNWQKMKHYVMLAESRVGFISCFSNWIVMKIFIFRYISWRKRNCPQVPYCKSSCVSVDYCDRSKEDSGPCT